VSAFSAVATPVLGDALLGVYRPASPVFVAGRGAVLIDGEGREYLDFTSGIGVTALGHGDAGVAAVASEALASGLIHTSNLFRTHPAMELAQELVERSFADRVFFCNSGAEANEAAIKFARRWAGAHGPSTKREIVALKGSFHGRLMGSLALTDRPAYREPFEPLMGGARFLDAEALDDAGAVVSAERTAAIFVEPVQGEGGVRPLPAATLVRLRELADAADALLVFDEVQCGLGRTGRLFAYESSGVVPDVLTLAKPLAGGLPMGAVLLADRVADVMKPGDHATTFGGGPLVSAVALHVLRRLADENLLARVRDLGDWLAGELTALPGVHEARGAGLMWGLVLAVPAAPVMGAALEGGLLVTTAGEKVVRLLPPLTISDVELERGLAILREVLA
jgi:predicted acetylornithine/succinylornithine family transaminase